MGDRREQVADAIRSVRSQREVDSEVVIVGNGTTVNGLDADQIIELPENVGVPAGRNAGLAACAHDFVCFLDDDARLLDDSTLRTVSTQFKEDPQLAVVGLRLVDDEMRTSRRHDPRLVPSTRPSRSVTSFPGGACVVRKAAFASIQGFSAPFFYALEETDLAWRLLESGWRISFEADLLVHHKRTDPRRHGDFVTLTARNRAWLAHRNLPMPLAVSYVTIWTILTLIRSITNPAEFMLHLKGLTDGLLRPSGPRAPMHWKTAIHMTKRGRPPII